MEGQAYRVYAMQWTRLSMSGRYVSAYNHRRWFLISGGACLSYLPYNQAIAVMDLLFKTIHILRRIIYSKLIKKQQFISATALLPNQEKV